MTASQRRIGVVMDPIDSITPKKDSSLAMLLEAERRGAEIHYMLQGDLRLVAATNRKLEEMVAKGRFRADLFYRLNVIPIHIPPLRERREDIALLVEFFVDKISKRLGKSIESIPTSVMNTLQEYQWPGNVRELENIVERTMVLTDRLEIRKDELPEEIISGSATAGDIWPTDSMSLKVNTKVLEKTLIQKALRETGNNRTRAARLLEISHPTLLSNMKAYKIS